MGLSEEWVSRIRRGRTVTAGAVSKILILHPSSNSTDTAWSISCTVYHIVCPAHLTWVWLMIDITWRKQLSSGVFMYRNWRLRYILYTCTSRLGMPHYSSYSLFKCPWTMSTGAILKEMRTYRTPWRRFLTCSGGRLRFKRQVRESHGREASKTGQHIVNFSVF